MTRSADGAVNARERELTASRQALLARLRSDHAAGNVAGEGDGREPVTMRPGTEPVRVVLLHPAGGELFCYTPLMRALSSGPSVVGFAADPRDALVPPREGMTVAAARIVRTLTAWDSGTGSLRSGTGSSPSGTGFVLAGWSYGGVLAFEIARQLEKEVGARPPIVVLDSCYYGDVVPEDEATLLRRFTHDIARLAGQDGPAVHALVSKDPAAQSEAWRDGIRETLVDLGVDLDLTDAELSSRYATFRACALALQCYSPPGPYSGPVSVLTTEARSAIEERWRLVCTGRFECADLPGDHYQLFAGAALDQVVARIEEALASLHNPAAH